MVLRRFAPVLMLLVAACSSDESAPELEMVHAVHTGSFVATVDGGAVLYALSGAGLHVLSKGADGAETMKVPLPAGAGADVQGNGALLLARDMLYGAVPKGLFAFDVSDRAAPKLVFQDTTSGGSTLALDRSMLFVALGPQVTAYDVGNPKAWRLAPGASPLSGSVPTTFIGPHSMALDGGRGFVVVADRDVLEVRRTADFTRVRQANGTDFFPTPVWSVVGMRNKSVLLCSAKEGLRSIALGDDGVLGAAATINGTPCNGVQIGDAAWLGLPITDDGQTPRLVRFGKVDLASGELREFTLANLNVVDEAKAPPKAIYGVGAFNGVVENSEFTYLDVGDLWVAAPRR